MELFLCTSLGLDITAFQKTTMGDCCFKEEFFLVTQKRGTPSDLRDAWAKLCTCLNACSIVAAFGSRIKAYLPTNRACRQRISCFWSTEDQMRNVEKVLPTLRGTVLRFWAKNASRFGGAGSTQLRNEAAG